MILKSKIKKAQEEKYKILASKSKKAQEEMVGFAVIIVIVAVIMLFLLIFYLRSSKIEDSSSYEAEGFVLAVLQYTSGCQDYSENLSVQSLIFACKSNSNCITPERNSCEVLNSTLNQIIDESWTVREGSVIKGYEMKIISDEAEMYYTEKGNKTRNYKGVLQDLPRDIKILFRAYY